VHDKTLDEEIAKLTLSLTKRYELELFTLDKEWEDKMAALTAEWVRQSTETAEVHGAEVDRLTRKHDYLYESCTTVQVVEGELVIN